ncbi:MAG: DsbA family protein, partial [Herbaspirillum sp.]
EVGLDTKQAAEILASDTYAANVRALERHYQNLGINSVPAIIINQKYLLQGGQPVEAFEQALRQIIAQSVSDGPEKQENRA